MKYLKKYKIFKESSEIEIKDSDMPDIKFSKINFNKFVENIKEFKDKKSKIDNAYINSGSDEELKKNIESIIGNNNENPFISEYLKISSLKRKVENLQRDISNNKISKNDFMEELNLIKDQETKISINKKISEITSLISQKTSDVNLTLKEIQKLENNMRLKMSNIKKELNNSIEKISTGNNK